MHAHQLQRRNEDFEEAILHLQRMRLKEKEWHDLKYGISNKELAVRSIVLLHDTRREKDTSWKLFFRWLGPYRICNAVKNKDTYILKELNGLHLAGIFAGDRLKKFYPRQELQLNQIPDLTHEIMPNLENFLANDGDELSNMPNNFYDI